MSTAGLTCECSGTTMIAFLELVTLNYASIFGLLEDAVSPAGSGLWKSLLTCSQHLTEQQFAWLGSIYYFGANRPP